MRFSEVIHVRPPIEVVVDAWARQDRAAEYAPGVLQRRVVGDGPIGRESRIAAIDRWPGFEVSYDIEIAVLERHRVAAILSEPLSGGWDAIFDVVDGRTEMRLEGTLNPGGALGLALPLLQPWLRRRWRATLAGFAEWVETGA